MTKKNVHGIFCQKSSSTTPLSIENWFLKYFTGGFKSFSPLKLANFETRLWARDTCHV